MSILLRRISELEKENYNLYCTIEQCNGRIEELEAENTRLREALEFYANTDVYEYYDKYESTAIQNEGGQKAREALKELLK